MQCYLCGNEHLELVFKYDKPDRYQLLIDNYNEREWNRCPVCGLYQQKNNLSEHDIRQCYLKYRDREIRETTVSEEFRRVLDMPAKKSECRKRLGWLLRHIRIRGPILDIGSGFGIFPFLLKGYVNEIYSIEPEPQSAAFINGELGIECKNEFYRHSLFPKAFIVTCAHVLEHMKDPIGFLRTILQYDMEPNGWLFIEIPDATEFDYLEKDHDEFNSLHLYFFDMDTLYTVLKRAGYRVEVMQRVKYKDRNLSRIMALCSAQ